MERRGTRVALWVWVGLVLLFLYIPIVVICLYAFDESNVQSWPISGLTTKWFGPAVHNGEMQQALWLSLEAAALATAVALVLGTLASFGVHRYRFFGRESISLLLVLPLALPGIITGMALNSYFTYWKLNFSLLTIVIGHATFCVGRRLQQRDRPAASRARFAVRGVHGPGRGRLADLPLRHLPDHLDRRSSRAASSPSRCRSTR